ncbi:MAG: SDR family oxidoreductase [Verrucomicrobia bacterium]|nr:SDR family oxidoreductase [Verrucomicrobiota bacterium]
MNRPRLDSKTVVIIGGTTGLGLSAAKAFLNSGARVVAVGRNPESVRAAQLELGGDAFVLSADAARSDTAPQAIEEALNRFGGFHGLYHVAGGSGRRMGDGPLHELTDAGWEATLNLNLTSVFYSNRAAVLQFQRQKSGGSILNLTSVLAYSPSPRFFATHAYATAKAAIIGLTCTSAAYYASASIRFNALAPALVETPMAQRAVQDDSIRQFIHTKQPLEGGRVGQPEDTDAAAVFFLSDDSRFITGQVLAVDGGWSVSEGQYPPDPPHPGPGES